MVQINLSEYYEYSFAQFLRFVHLQDDLDYLLTLPKETLAYKSANFDVFWEYYNAAFVGQQLWQLSSTFTYIVPCILTPGKFIFQFKATEKEKLAEALYFLANGLSLQNNEKLANEYNTQAARLVDDAFDGKENIACYGLIWIANLFLAN